jgi:hypothetical protein
MPAEQSGLLAEAVKFTGDASSEPLAGDVTVTTGVVANATLLNVAKPEKSSSGKAKRAYFIEQITSFAAFAARIAESQICG